MSPDSLTQLRQHEVYFLAEKIEHLLVQRLLSSNTKQDVDLITFAQKFSQLGLTEFFVRNFLGNGGRIFLVDLKTIDFRSIRISPRNLVVTNRQLGYFFTGDKVSDQPQEIAENDLPRWIRGLDSLLQKAVAPPLPILLALLQRNGPDGTKGYLHQLPEFVFRAAKYRIPAGSNCRLSWSVTSASDVRLWPGGESVGLQSSKHLKITRDSEFSLTIERPEGIYQKSLSVCVLQWPVIEYQLFAFNHDGTEELLTSHPDLPHHYGVLAEDQLVLRWKVYQADRVQLSPYGQTERIGEKKLKFNSNPLVLRFRAERASEQVDLSITIKQFSVPDPNCLS